MRQQAKARNGGSVAWRSNEMAKQRGVAWQHQENNRKNEKLNEILMASGQRRNINERKPSA